MTLPVKSLYSGLDWPLIGDLDGRDEVENSHLQRKEERMDVSDRMMSEGSLPIPLEDELTEPASRGVW